MKIEISQNGRFTVFALHGRLDALTAPEFEGKASGVVDDGANAIILDLSHLEFVSSAGLRGFLSLAKNLRETQGEIRFAGLREAVHEVFTISGFPKMFAIYSDVNAAAETPEAE